MKNTMKQIGMTLFVVFLLLGSGDGQVAADNLSEIIFGDGRVMNATSTVGQDPLPKPSDMIYENLAYGSAPFKGNTGDSQKGLAAHGVSLKAPNAEAIAKLEPIISPIEDESVKPVPLTNGGAEIVLGGVDTRTRNYTTDYPASAVVLIESNAGVCTGWLVGPDTVITAGHCVHSGGPWGIWYTDFVVYPGYDNGIAPYGSCGYDDVASVSGWVNHLSEKYDYGAIKLDCTVGNATGWFGFTKKGKKNYPTRMTGYPEDKLRWTQWETADRVKVKKPKQVFYSNDTAGGMSGSPVWSDQTGKNVADNGAYAFAIHAYRTHGRRPHNKYNHGTRIDKTAFNNISYWRNEW